MKHVGFTGTQRGMTDAQKGAFTAVLISWWVRCVFHLGDCIGADTDAYLIARCRGHRLIGHPPLIASKRSFLEYDEERPQLGYMARNQVIVDESQIMIATPGEFEEQLRSGTWSTVRRARKAGRPLLLIWPDGTTSVERWS